MKFLLRAAAALLAVPALAQSVAAAPAASRQTDGVADPAAFVRDTYARLTASFDHDPPNAAYSPRLRLLFADAALDDIGEVGRLDFDFWVDGQDAELGPVEITSEDPPGPPDLRTVAANFTNFGKPVTILFYFKRIDGRWYLDDARNLPHDAEDGVWVLSLLLEYGR